MTKFKLFFFLSLSIFLFEGCSYPFSEDYFLNLDEAEPTGILQLDPFLEGVTLREPTNYNFSFNGNGKHRLINVNISIDNRGILGTDNSSGNFEINTDQLDEGSHVLTITYRYSSGSGSLSDINGSESFVEKTDYEFTVDKTAPPQAVITEVRVDQGSVLVLWEPIESDRIVEAFLQTRYPESNFVLSEFELSLDQLKTGRFLDTKTVALELEYQIILRNRYAESKSNFFDFSLNKPSIKAEIVSNSTYVLVWEQHPLFNNVSYYTFYDQSKNETIQMDKQGGRYTVNSNPVFAQTIGIGFQVWYNNRVGPSIAIDIDFGDEFEAKSGVVYKYSQLTESVYTIILDGPTTFNAPRDVVLYQLSPIDLSILKSKILFTIQDSSADLTIDPTTQNLILDLKENAYTIDINSFEILNSWALKDYTTDLFGKRIAYRNGKVFAYTFSNSNFSVYDANSRNQLYSDVQEFDHYIADDGNAFINKNSLFVWNGASYTQNLQIPKIGNVSVHEAIFIPNQNLCIYSNVRSNPIVYNYQTGSSYSVFDATNIGTMRYDNQSNTICMIERTSDFRVDKVSIFEFNSGIKKILNVNGNYRYYYLNETLISNSGLYQSNYFKN